MYFHRILCNKIISSILVKRLIRSSVDANASQTLDDHKKLKVHQFNQSARLEITKKVTKTTVNRSTFFYFCELPILTTILFIHSIGWQVFRIGYRPPITLLCFSKNSGWCKKGPLFTWLQSTSNQIIIYFYILEWVLISHQKPAHFMLLFSPLWVLPVPWSSGRIFGIFLVWRE